MLTFVRGDLFESPAQVLVNTVNTVGVMGKGIALTFKQVYPDMFKRYQVLCEQKQLEIGKLWLHKTEHKWILNFPTKSHWRNPSRLEYIEAGLQKFVSTYTEQGIASVAFPELGCGNGELDWDVVRPVMLRYLRPLPINVYIYLYDHGSWLTPEHREAGAMKTWLRREPRSLPFSEFWGDLQTKIGTGASFAGNDRADMYTAQVVRYENYGLLLGFANRTRLQQWRDGVRHAANEFMHKWRFASDRTVYIPEDSLLALWQSIRFYGFCFKRMMPDGLDQLWEYLLPLLSTLPYLKKVRIAMGADDNVSTLEDALQLYVTDTAKSGPEAQLQLISA
jgi:O-acetyl-ADP-ribose deacetylase (regulator of RNase III)